MQGNLQQRGPPSWRIRVFLGPDESGKKRYLERTVRSTKREAQRFMARLVTEIDEGRHVAAAATRFGEVLDRWLEVKATVIEPTTLASYRWIAETYVRPRLGKRVCLEEGHESERDVRTRADLECNAGGPQVWP